MIEFITILIILEIFTGIWLIQKLNNINEKVISLREKTNKPIFNGNLTEIKLALRAINKKIDKIIFEKTQKKNIDNINKAINFLFLIISTLSLLNKKQKQSRIKK